MPMAAHAKAILQPALLASNINETASARSAGSVKNSVSSLKTLDRLGKGNRHEVKVEYCAV